MVTREGTMDEQNVLKMQQRKDFLIKFCYWVVIAVCVYAVFKYLLPVLFPFVLAYGIDILAKPVQCKNGTDLSKHNTAVNESRQGAGKRNGGTAHEENKKGNGSASGKLADGGNH